MNNLLNRGKEEEELELVDTVQATLPHGQTTHIPVFAVKTMPTVVAAVEKIDDDAPPLVSLIPETVRLLSVAGVVKPPPPLPPQTVSVSPVILSQRGESMVQGEVSWRGHQDEIVRVLFFLQHLAKKLNLHMQLGLLKYRMI